MTRKKSLLLALIGLLLWVFCGPVQANDGLFCDDRRMEEPCIRYGAKVFVERCSICHGTDGMGEGIIPMLVEGYPDTNLFKPKKSTSRDMIRDMVIYGKLLSGVNEFSPPWSEELTRIQIDAVTDFIVYYRDSFEKALTQLKKIRSQLKPSYEMGRMLFLGRCALCHGETGHGDGKMSPFIRNPSPANLVKTKQTDWYLKQIITKGGEAMQRSSKMPPWGAEFTSSDIGSLVLYVKALRHHE